MRFLSALFGFIGISTSFVAIASICGLEVGTPFTVCVTRCAIFAAISLISFLLCGKCAGTPEELENYENEEE